MSPKEQKPTTRELKTEGSTFIIETGVPIPPKHLRRRTSARMIALDSLEIGQCVVLPIKSSSYLSQMTAPLREKGKRFTSRNEVNGVRIWRTK